MIKICVFTGTRAEYGLLSGLMRLIEQDDACELLTIVTGAHLSAAHGETYRLIEADGFRIDAKADILKFDDTRAGTAKTVGLAVGLFADILAGLKPDLAVILGDRYEMLAAAEACFFMNVPIAHLHGGEITEGAFDDSIRHCITKLSRLHFTSTESYRQRVIRMGERPECVFNVGAIGLDNMKHMSLMTESEARASVGAGADDKIVLFTYHPETNDTVSVNERIETILGAINRVMADENVYVVFTGANADPGGRVIDEEIERLASARAGRAYYVPSLGQLRYLSVMKYSSCVMGNSSSGILEAPTFHVPTLNIGGRQTGRTAADSVINCDYDAGMIEKKLSEILQNGRIICENPYEKSGTAENILKIIKTSPDLRAVPKKFYDNI